MSTTKVEFAGGGPADGTVRDIPGGAKPAIMVYAMTTDPIWNLEEPEDRVSVITHVYRRQDRLSKTGARIYAYAGRKRRS